MRCFALILAVVLAQTWSAEAAEHSGHVTFNNLPVPGATVVATRDVRTVSTVSADDGSYRFDDLEDGPWTIQVEMAGFASTAQTIEVAASTPPATFALILRPFSEMMTSAAVVPVRGASMSPAAASSSDRDEQPAAEPRQEALPASADSFLVNGSVNNSAASAFAQMAAFGNNRRSGRSLYNGGLRVNFGSSAWDSRPFSFDQSLAPSPDYGNMQLLGTFGGPVRIPGVLRNGPQLFVGVQHALDHSATSQSARVPTARERQGDFSQSTDGLGQPIAPIDPLTGEPFPNRQIPSARISPEATALLALYPTAEDGSDRYQTSTLGGSRQTNVQVRASQTLNRRDSLFGTVLYNNTRSEGTDWFGLTDLGRESIVNGTMNWSRRVSQFLSVRVGYEGVGQTNRMLPYFANRTNVSGNAGISGNNQQPENWGPPALTFGSGIATLVTPAFADNHGRTDTFTGEVFRNIGRHNVTIGGGTGRQQLNVWSQQDARGGFSFTGAVTGSDVGDLLLGLPSTASIAYGNADKFLSGAMGYAYLSDDWRVSSSLTLNLGVRWEFEEPMSEQGGRLANIDVAPDFSTAATMVSGESSGPVSGVDVGPSLLRADARGLQPRVGAAWRPVAGSSLVLRGGYGVYRNSGVYQAVALLMAQQAPFSTSANLASSASQPLRIADAFVRAETSSANTFGVDPALRIGYAHNWQFSAQRDLPASLTILGNYTGTAGRHLMQEFLPNTFPFGGQNPCPSCPAGYVYLTSDGTSLRNAAQVQVRRRLRNGLLASVQYTLAKATDNASAFVPTGNPLANGAGTGSGGTSSGIAGATIAQDWRDLDAEHGRSVFDRRHQLSIQFQFTSGMGVTGGALRSGAAAALLNGWTITTELTANSGAPLTPIVVSPVGGTGVVGTLRPALTGAESDGTDGAFLNAAAYTEPSSGQWGNAGRNSGGGPSEFYVNAGLGRSFQWGDRTSAEWRLDSTNLFNQVNYTAVNTVVGNPQFGLPTRAAAMRKVQMSLRIRF